MKKHLMFVLALPCAMQAHLEYGGKTQYQLRQYDSGIGREQSLWHTHTTNDLGNPYGVSLQVVPFVSVATHTNRIAKQFTLQKSTALSVASDRFLAHGETTLPYHAIKHNTAVDAAEESAMVTLQPCLTIAGATLSMFYDGAHLQPGLAGSLSAPLFYIDAHLDQSGATPTINEYLHGRFLQESPRQEALLYGRLGSNSAIKVGPLSAQLTYNLIENEQSFAGVAGGLSISLLSSQIKPTYSQPIQAHMIIIKFLLDLMLVQLLHVTMTGR